MTHLSLALMGDFQAKLDSRPAEGLNSNRLQGLLACLAVESGREHPRELIASLLWPERPDQEALSSLRYALSNLRHALRDRRSPQAPFLLISRTHVQFNPLSYHWLDVAEFQSLVGRSDLPDLEQAAALYRGPFLDGLSLADSPAFEEWMLLKGEEIQRSVLTLLERLAVIQMSRGETAQAARWARRQLELDPYREQAHRQLMAALAIGGERPAALAHFDICRRLLAEELGCEPEDETQALVAQIRAGDLPELQPAALVLSGLIRQASAAAGAGPAGLDFAPSRPATRFVARQAELAKLGSLLDQALDGRGGAALIAGEAGSGKTALLDEFSRQAWQRRLNLIALRGNCSAYAGVGDPFLPFREMLQTLAGEVDSKRAGGTLSPEQARRIWEALPTVGAALVEHGPDLIDRYVPGEVLLHRLESFSSRTSATRWQVRLRELLAHARGGTAAHQPDLFAQITQVLRTISMHNPLLLAIDDLQWADGGTAALLFHLGRRLAGSRILILCAYRPLGGEANQVGASASGMAPNVGASQGIGAVLHELIRQWGDILIDLDQVDGRAFVEAFVDNEPNRLDESFRQNLYDHTAGNPLFTAELLRSFERQGWLVKDEGGCWIEAPDLDWGYCPPQVEAVIAGHLAGLLDEDQALLHAAAVQGEQFIAEVLARALVRDDKEVIQRLSGSLRRQHRLVEAVSQERLVSTGQCLSYYRFRHSLIQRSAYARLDAVERVQLHEATGQALEAIYTAEEEKPQSLASALARHYEAAGLHLAAARSLYEAGRQAMQLAAFRQALNLFDHGSALLAGEPPSSACRGIKQMLEVARLGPLHNLTGAGGTEWASALAWAGEAGAGDIKGRPKLQLLLSEGQHLTAQGQLEAGLVITQQMHDLATKWGDEAFIGLAHWRFGHIYNILGKLDEAEKHFNWLLAWLTPEWQAELITANGYGLTAHALCFSALDQWWLGYPEQALIRCNQAVAGELAQSDPYGQTFACGVGCTVLFLLRSDSAGLKARSELCLRLAHQQGFTLWMPYAEVFQGWLAVMDGGDLAGVSQMQDGIACWQDMGMAIGADGLAMVLVDGCLVAARRQSYDGLRDNLLATGLAAVEPFLGPQVPYGQSYQPELYRLKGELLLEYHGLVAAGEALTCFQQSMQLGREMEALAWELRTAMSLVRLRKRQGEVFNTELGEARKLLSGLYERFTEGFSFPDLQEAIALINETG